MKRRRMQTVITVVGVVIVIGIFSLRLRSRMSARPANIGVTDGRLAPAPASPNCVSTQTESEEHRIKPFAVPVENVDAMACIRTIIGKASRTTIINETENYLHAEFRSRLFSFVDDVEFYFDAANKVVHFRSASRTGYSDLGVNRTRMEQLRREFVKCCEQIPGE